MAKREDFLKLKGGDRVRVTVDAKIVGMDTGEYGDPLTLLMCFDHRGNGPYSEAWVNDANIVSIEKVRPELPEGWCWRSFGIHGEQVATLRNGLSEDLVTVHPDGRALLTEACYALRPSRLDELEKVRRIVRGDA